MGDQSLTTKVTLVSILVFEAIMIILYGVFVEYHGEFGYFGSMYHEFVEPTFTTSTAAPQGKQLEVEDVGLTPSENNYSMFQNVQVMVFVGFAFLMTYLKKYARSALGFSFLLACIVVQWYILVDGFLHWSGGRTFVISLTSLINGDLAAATVLISFGAVLGQFTPLQLFFMAIIETCLYVANKYIFEEMLEAMDVGGSMYIHEFGAYFGLSASFILGLRKGVQSKSDLENSSYLSDVTSMIGTFFLWVFWPSFNGILAAHNSNIIILNTYLALCASVLCAMGVGLAVSKSWKFNMMIVQNATLAGGVGIGACCNLNIHPVGALIIGSISGTLSVIGFRFLRGPLSETLRIHDTCGVHFLHGIPGFLGGFAGALLAFFPSSLLYKEKWNSVYPSVATYNGRSEIMQGVFQVVALVGSLGLAIVGGLLTGALAVFALPNLEPEERYDDDIWWEDDDGNAPSAA